MTQETIAQSSGLGNNGDRQVVLSQLHRSLDASIRRDEGYRLRAIGLQNFYIQMADPSIEAIEVAAASLIAMPFKEISELQFASYNAGENPQGYFARCGVELEDGERVVAGISNSGLLIDRIADRFDYDTGEFIRDENLYPSALALEIHEEIQISNSERQIRIAARDMRSEPDLAVRHKKGLVLKDQVLAHITNFPYTFYRGEYSDRVVEPAWDILLHSSSLFTEINTKYGGSISGNFHLGEEVDTAEASVLRYPFERRLDALPKRDKDRLDELRLQFGAKAANLIILSGMVEGINELRKADIFDLTTIQVPEFQAVPVDVYRAWVEGKLSDGQLKPYFKWVSGLRNKDRWGSRNTRAEYIVRSSAVFSEDGENLTGAGIYESVRVPANATFQEFKDAVVRVYASTESPQAKEYREQHGIDKEEMGLVIQKFVSSERYNMQGSQEGYVNSRLTGVPQLMEIVTGTSRNFVKRQELDFVLAMAAGVGETAFRNVQQFPPDIFKIRPDLPVRVAQLVYVVERIWGKDIQVEFVVEDLHTINFVQVRDLPEAALGQGVEVQFPDEEPIHSGASIGVGDMELDVLGNTSINREKSGVVIFQGNNAWSWFGKPYAFPKEGAVVVVNEDGKNGHIQTLAAESGLICIFPDGDKEKPTLTYDELLRLDRVRVVSNGIEARMYNISGEQDPIVKNRYYIEDI